MNSQDISNQLATFLADEAMISADDIQPEHSFNDLGLDSAALISLAAFIESKFNVVATANDLATEKTISDVADFISFELAEMNGFEDGA